MNELPILLADITEWRSHILMAIRIAVCVVGAIVAYFLAGPVFGLVYRLFSPRKGMSGGWMLLLRVLSAGGVATLLYFCLPEGFGSGLGLGPGGGPGKGPGSGVEAGSDRPTTTTGKPNDSKNIGQKGRDKRIVIEMMPSTEKKFYVVKHKDTKDQKDTKDPPRNFDELKKLVVDNKDSFEVRISYGSDDAPGSRSDAVRELRKLLEENRIPHTEDKE